ncbi:hypothetical protein SARC_04154 [Sphaeroforma arctica JP610]|uniref:Uncharacterized protein n=1 Tax=Sphaeroforma arctica JP610 TaxID=667725 RepID=A0A0L0G3H1_9EUKA|nr:hypothetical protein SARC_04154 [Sphaeroforma arctica JP610]KNC83595.1 hypothetical protein SARC_04154 [Sphaeroforma arctica JP610]|eukprot:XP_014157497.1 hypothetical protein SARC_04154 [Sphaeroforma arctica JP610]
MTEVLKHTEPDHFDYDDLLNICHKIEAALMSTNTEKGEMENNEKYYSYLALIDNLDRDLYSLMKPGQMIHEFDCGYSLSVENEGKQKGYNVKTNNKLIIINSAAFVLRPYQNSDNKRHYTALKVVRFNDVDIMFAVPEGTLHFVVLTKDREGDSDRFIVHFKDLKSRDKVLELFVEQLKLILRTADLKITHDTDCFKGTDQSSGGSQTR